MSQLGEWYEAGDAAKPAKTTGQLPTTQVNGTTGQKHWPRATDVQTDSRSGRSHSTSKAKLGTLGANSCCGRMGSGCGSVQVTFGNSGMNRTRVLPRKTSQCVSVG